MFKNIKKYKKNLEKEGKIEESLLYFLYFLFNLTKQKSYNFTPLTYQLPNEYSIFCEEFKKTN